MRKLSLESALTYYGVHFTPGRREQMVRCPAHVDNTPSMSVNLIKEVLTCHSCGLGGTPLNLIMSMEGLDASGARDFAASAGIEGSDTDGSGGTLRTGGISGRRVSGFSGNRSGNKRWVWSGSRN